MADMRGFSVSREIQEGEGLIILQQKNAGRCPAQGEPLTWTLCGQNPFGHTT